MVSESLGESLKVINSLNLNVGESLRKYLSLEFYL